MQEHNELQQQNKQLIAAAAILGGILLLGVIALPVINSMDRSTPSAENPRIIDMLANENSFVGRTVSVEGEIDEYVNAQSFVFDQKGTMIGDEILVFSRKPLEPVGGGVFERFFSEGDTVHVAGQVQKFNREAIEGELQAKLDEELVDEWEGKLVIIADTVK